MENSADVLVIGAGPVGLTVANDLVKNGIKVRIVEKLSSIREISKALIWHVRTQEALDKIGIIEKGKLEAAPLKEVVVNAYGNHIGSWDLDKIDSPHQHPLIIGQNRTQHLLNDLLESRGAQVDWSTEALTMQMDDNGVTTELVHQIDGKEEKETIRTKYIVGCEGSNSLVRKTLNLTFEGERYSGEQFIQADCKLDWVMPKGRSYLFLTNDGYLMVIEMPHDVVRVFISLPDKKEQSSEVKHALGAAEDISNEPTLDEISENLERLTGYKAKLSNPIWLARYRTSHRYANMFRVNRAFVCGDAGHVHVPIGGQGMNTGIQDGFNLAWKLAGYINGYYNQEILDTYNAERHPVAESLIKGTDFAYNGILHPSELKQRIVKLLGPYIISSDFAQNFMRNTLEELTISYPNSPLNLDAGHVKGPKPGSRAEEAIIVRLSDYKTTSIYELLRNQAWVLLIFSGKKEKESFVQSALELLEQLKKYEKVLKSYVITDKEDIKINLVDQEILHVDTNYLAHDKYEAQGSSLFLIRPDSVIAFRGRLKDRELLTDYLTKNIQIKF